MTQFIQAHILTSYPPSNLNRDKLGRPKTAMMGGVNRLRISSQCLKRSWRTSELFTQELKGTIGIRTQKIGIDIYKKLIDKKVEKKEAREWAKNIASQFGKLKYDSKPVKGDDDSKKEHDMALESFLDLEISELIHFDTEELIAIDNLINHCVGAKREPSQEELNKLMKKSRAADIACFGRMLASQPKYNTEAAIQVSHALTTHAAETENDFFTAIDDLNEGTGSAYLNENDSLFSAGLFYIHLCIDVIQLIENLNNDKKLAEKTIKSILKCALQVSPKGKQNSFSSTAYASYALIEMGYQQPRNLSVAFLRPINEDNLLENSIDALQKTREKFSIIYEENPQFISFNVLNGEGSLKNILDFVEVK